MATNKRALRRDFIALMDGSGAWPIGTRFKKWRDASPVSMGNHVYGEMITGMPIVEKNVTGFCQYFLSCLTNNTQAAFCDAFTSYLRRAGIDTPAKYCDVDIAQMILAEREEDGLRRGIDGITELLKLIPEPERRVILRQRPEHSEAAVRTHVEEAVLWLYVHGGRLLSRNMSLPADRAIAKYAKRLRQTLRDFQNRAIAWHEFNPWTVVHSRGRRVANGMSIVLPLHPEVYDDIRSGQRFVSNLTPNDMRAPSRHLFVHSCHPSPRTQPDDIGNWEYSSVATLMTQIGVLAGCHDRLRDETTFLLSVAGSPESRARLANHWFRPTRTLTAVDEYQLYERIVGTSLHKFHREDVLFQSCLRALAQCAIQPKTDGF